MFEFWKRFKNKIEIRDRAINELSTNLDNLDEKIKGYIKENQSLSSKNSVLGCKLDSAKKENLSIRREQTEADLLLISVRIALDIIQGKTKIGLFPSLIRQQQLNNQLSGIRAAQGAFHSFGLGALGSGLGNVFGKL